MSGRVDIRGGIISDVGTVGTLEAGGGGAGVSGTVQVGTVGVIGTLGTILSPIAIGAVAAIGTVGTIQAGAVTASVSGGVLQDVGTIGTILSPVAIGAVAAVATVGTLQAGAISATITGGNIAVVATILSDQQGATGTLFAATLFYGVNSQLLAGNAVRKEFTVTLVQPGTVAIGYQGTIGSLAGIQLVQGQTLGDGIYTGVVSGMNLVVGSVVVSVHEVTP